MNHLATPRATPEKQIGPIVDGTPSKLGAFLKNQIASHILPTPTVGLDTWIEREDVDETYRNQLLASGKQPQDKVVKDTVNRFMGVARLITVSAPEHLDAFTELQKIKMKLMFSKYNPSCSSSDCSDFNELSDGLAITLEEYTRQYNMLAGTLDPSRRASASVHLAARFFALKVLDHTVVAPPRNMCWWFIFLHQLVLEKIAIRHPSACGFRGFKTQKIEETVNDDLERLCTLALNKPVPATQLKGLKVLPIVSQLC